MSFFPGSIIKSYFADWSGSSGSGSFSGSSGSGSFSGVGSGTAAQFGIVEDDEHVIEYNGRKVVRVQYWGGELVQGPGKCGERIVDQARSRLGDPKYHILFYNCEQFAKWCHSEGNKSVQAAVATDTAGVVATGGDTAATATGVVASGGGVAAAIGMGCLLFLSYKVHGTQSKRLEATTSDCEQFANWCHSPANKSVHAAVVADTAGVVATGAAATTTGVVATGGGVAAAAAIGLGCLLLLA